MSGVRETACSTCIHLLVCKYKDEYLKAVKAVQDAYISRVIDENTRGIKYVRDFEFIELRDPRCRHFDMASI